MSGEHAAVRAGSAEVLLSAMFTNFRASYSKSGCSITTARHAYAHSKWNEIDSMNSAEPRRTEFSNSNNVFNLTDFVGSCGL